MPPSPLLSRRSLRRRKRTSVSGPGLVILVALGSVLVLWAIGALFTASVDLYSSFSKPKPSLPLLTLKGNNGQPFIRHPPDLWPSDFGSIRDLLEVGLYSTCLPTNVHCAVPHDNKHVTILRTPGVLGKLTETLKVQQLQNDVDPDRQILVVQEINRLEAQQGAAIDESYLVRVAVLPPLLEALDLVLETRDRDVTAAAFAAEIIVSLDEIIEVVHLVLLWHCRIDHFSNGRALFTLSLDETLSYPTDAQSDLVDFLGLEATKFKKANMASLVEPALQRVLDASRLVEHLDNLTLHIDRAIQKEVDQIRSQTDNCLTQSNTTITTGMQTRITQLVAAALGFSSLDVCAKYPQSLLCSKSPG